MSDLCIGHCKEQKRGMDLFMKETNLVRTSLSIATALVISLSTLTSARAEDVILAESSSSISSTGCAVHKFNSGIGIKAATLTTEGEKFYNCTVCGETKIEAIPKLTDIKNAEISGIATKYKYTKSAIKPAVTLKIGGKTLTKGRDYTVTYGTNTKPGKGTVTIKGIGTYGGSVTKVFVITPAKGAISKVTSTKAGAATVKIKKSVGATGYRIAYSKDKTFKTGVKYVTVKASKLTATIKKLTGGKVYYFKVRAYKTVSGKNYYGPYSAVKKVTIKKTAAQLKAAKQKIVCDYAKANVGGSYVYCGTSFRATDCSGLTMQCFAQVGISLPHNAAAQAYYGTPVSYSDMQAGDLIICCGGGHAALYVGNGYFVHATNEYRGIVIDPVSQLQYYGITSIRRLI